MTIKFHWMHRKAWENTSEGLLDMAKTLEDSNISSVLLPYGPNGTDFLLHAPEILQSTKNLKILIALAAYAVTPEYVLKTFDTIQRFGPNRLDLNLVAGSYDKPRQDFIVNNYPWDTSQVDSHEKRVALTEKWMEKFNGLMKDQQFSMIRYVVGTSETTIKVANEYADYLIINHHSLNDNFLSKVKNCKIMLVVDPLIFNDEEDLKNIEYYDYQYIKDTSHYSIKGNYQEVVNTINDISKKFNINDFLIHTDQKDLTQLLKLAKEFS